MGEKDQGPTPGGSEKKETTILYPQTINAIKNSDHKLQTPNAIYRIMWYIAGMKRASSLPKKATHLNKINKELSTSHIFFKHLAELSPEAVVVHSEGTIVYANPAAVKLIEANTEGELIGQPVMRFIHPDSIPLIRKRIKTMLTKHLVAPYVEEKFISLKGKIILAETKAVPFTYEGKPAILAIMNDITEKKRLENNLKRSEERFRTLIQQSADAIQLLNKNGEIMYTSDSIKRVLGYTPSEIRGQNALPYLHPEDLPRFMEAFQKLLKLPGGEASLTYRVRHKNGSWQWIEATSVNHIDNPAIQAIVGNFRNITKRKNAEECEKYLEQITAQLNASLDYKTTLQNICKMLVPYFADYIRIVLISDSNHLEEVAAYHTDPKKSKLVKKLFESYRNHPHADFGVLHIIQSGKPEIIEKVTQDMIPDGKSSKTIQRVTSKLQLTSYIGVPLKLKKTVVGVITFSLTGSERIYTKEDLHFSEEIASRIVYAIENARLFAQAKKTISLRDDFISLASHELKTPLTSLKIYIQSLDRQFEKRGDLTYSQYFQKINLQTNKLTQLVNDLLDISKIRQGKLEYTMETLDINRLVTDTVSTLSEISKQHVILVTGEIRKAVYADPYRIAQVLTNLLTNAMKYSPHADKIIVSLLQDEAQAKIAVQDFGIGIDPKDQKKIFAQFYRVSNSLEKTFPGLGMGLFISHEIIKRHSGLIQVDSQKGKGSIFSFTIPYCQ